MPTSPRTPSGSRATPCRASSRSAPDRTEAAIAAPPARGLVRRRHNLVRLALLTVGWCFLAIGLLGGLLPVIQGWPFGVAGAVILYVESRWFQRTVRRWRLRHPKLDASWQRLRAWRRSRRKPRAVPTDSGISERS